MSSRFGLPLLLLLAVLAPVLADGFIGVAVKPASASDQDKKGMLVQEIARDSPAQKAKIEKGDVILKIDQTETNDLATFQRTIAAHKAGDEVSLTILRDGKQLKLKLTLVERPK